MILDIDPVKLDPTQKEIPSWPCPKCYSGSLLLVVPLSERETRRSRTLSKNTGDRVCERLFSGVLECDDAECGRLVGISGTKYFSDEPINSAYDTEHIKEVEILYLSPSPHFFRLDERMPEKVRKALASAFDLYWIDIHSAANKIRLALELTLSDKGISTKKENGKFKSLADQIKEFNEQNVDEFKNAMTAVRWLGNSGSHADDRDLNRIDLVRGFEVMSVVLRKMYCDDSEHLQNLAAELTSKHGS